MIDACIGLAAIDLANGTPRRAAPCGFTARESFGRRDTCPRCGGDIEARPRTREEALAAIDACRLSPCSECPDEDHHWLIDYLEDDDDALEEFRAEHPQAFDEHGDPFVPDANGNRDPDFAVGFVACKHCPAVKAWEGEDH